jgi:hypothetical protein
VATGFQFHGRQVVSAQVQGNFEVRTTGNLHSEYTKLYTPNSTSLGGYACLAAWTAASSAAIVSGSAPEGQYEQLRSWQ